MPTRRISPPAPRRSQQRRVSQHSCGQCSRPGDLVCQFAQPATPHSGINAPWVFRYYLCRWHRAAWNRTRLPNQKKMTVQQLQPDAAVLANTELSSGHDE